MPITGAITMVKALENGNELNLLQTIFEIVIGIRKKTLLKVSICVSYCVLQMPQTHSVCLPSCFLQSCSFVPEVTINVVFYLNRYDNRWTLSLTGVNVPADINAFFGKYEIN